MKHFVTAEIKHIFVCIFFLALGSTSIAQSQKAFNKLLKTYNLGFDMPNGFHKTKVIENEDLYYNYAIELDDNDFEVRYSIFPLKPLFEDYEASLSDSTRTVLNPNKYHKSMFIANILNVSQAGMQNMPETAPFPSEAVKEEFGADYGANSFFLANSEYGKNHEYCLMMVLHKEDVADIYVAFLSNDKDSFEENMLRAFHTIRFN